jgi:tetratricopeptide (TPR) repeat protein
MSSRPQAGEFVDLALVDDAMICPSCGTICQPSHKFCPGCGFPMDKLREQAEDPLVGKTLPGGHVVLELIDVGGMGRVYRAEQRMLGRTVAVKIIHPHLLGDETVEARFITEARAASQLNHPNSVGVIDFGKFEGRLYMVMEYIRGRDLATVAHEDGPLAVDRVVDIVCQSLAALEEAHAVGIIHRDLKPENIVLAPLRSGGDFVKVLDFGLAKVLEMAQSKRITDPGMVCGTPEYMAPEQARGDDVDHRADIYSTGVLLYELLAGRLPFEGTNPREVVLMHLSKPPPDLRAVAGRPLPEALIAVVTKALAKMPRDRYESAASFSRALRATVERASRSTAHPAVSQGESAASIECPNCAATMPAAQKFCGECGTRMSLLPPLDDVLNLEDRTVSRPLVEELPFVGRDDELGWLFERRDEATRAFVACQIVGHAGAGKSRLLEEFARHGDHWGDVVVTTKPDPWGAGAGYFALQRAIAELAALPPGGGGPSHWPGASPEVRAGLDAVFDREQVDNRQGRGPRRRWSETPPLGPGEGNRRLLVSEALRWAIGRAHTRSEGGVVVLAIDDLHAIDGASQNAFLDVVSDPPLVPALILGAHRPSFDAAWESCQRLEVRGLPTTVAASLLSEGEAQPAPDEGDERRVSPMYVDQLRRFGSEGGDDPPTKLADLIALRIERLPVAARRILQAVSVLGDATTEPLLELVLQDDGGHGELIDELRVAGFVTVDGANIGSGHPLIREVARAGTPAGVRRDLHARARSAGAQAATQAPLEADALHAFLADQSFEALMLLEQTADASRARDDADGAVEALRMALDLARREMARGELDDPVAAALMFSCKLGDALCLAGKHIDAEGVLTEALDLAGPASAERARLLASLANVARGIGRADLAFERLDEAVRIAERSKFDGLLDTLDRMRTRWVQGL